MPQRGLPRVKVLLPFQRPIANRPGASSFGAANNGYRFGDPAHLINIGPLATYMAWINPNVVSGVRRVFNKGNPTRLVQNAADMEMIIQRATAQLQIIGQNVLTVGVWAFVCFLLDFDGGDTDQKWFFGSAGAPAVEASSYGTRTVGSGTRTTNAGTEHEISAFNLGSQALDGHCGFAAIWDRRLSLGEIREQQFRPHPTFRNLFLVMPNQPGTRTGGGFPRTGTPIRDLSPFRVRGEPREVTINPYNPLPVTVDIGLARGPQGFVLPAVTSVQDVIMAGGMVPFPR